MPYPVPEENDAALLEKQHEVFNRLKATENFSRVTGKVVPIRATTDVLVCELVIEADHVNFKGTLHGGFSATLVDVVTSRAVRATRDCTTASIEISISYLRPVKLNEKITIIGRVLKSGRTIAFAECIILDSKNEIAVAGKQTMAILDQNRLRNLHVGENNVAVETATNGLVKKDTKEQNDDINAHLSELLEEFQLLQQIINFNCVGAGAIPVFASPEKIVVELEVHKGNVNAEGFLDDGFVAGFTDVVTARAIGLNIKEFPMVSVDISVSYLLPVEAGDVLEVEAKMLKDEGGLVFAEAEYRRRSDGRLAAKGRHTVAKLPKPPPGVAFERY